MNASILVIFVALLIYSAFQIVQITSKNQFEDIRESIISYNEQLLLTFVKSQSITLNKDIQLISEEIHHVSLDFAHDFSDEKKTDELRNNQITLLNNNLKSFINNVSFIDMNNNVETVINDGVLENFKNKVNLEKLKKYQDFYIEKRVYRRSIDKFFMYIKPEHWANSLLKFELNLDYFSDSLTFEDMIEKLQYRYFLVDDQGNLIASNLRQNAISIMEHNIPLEKPMSNVANKIMSNGTGSFSINTDEGVYNITFFKNENTAWRLILVTPESVVRSSFSTTKELLLSEDGLLLEKLFISTIALLLLSLSFNYVAINRLIAPISKLIDQARSLKRRDFTKATSLVLSNGDEIEQLSKAYCEAGEQIKVLIEGLESEVDERTNQYEIATKKAKEANKHKSILLSNVSHEIRTPLNAIIGYTYMLNKSGAMDLKHKCHLDGISAASHTILSIVNDLLDLERVQASNYTLHSKLVSLPKLLDDIEMTFSLLAVNKELELIVQSVGIGYSSTIYIDELRFKQAISNIISNAIKFTNQGRVVLTVSVEMHQGNKKIVFSIDDTGVGIPENKIESIFNNFEQVNHDDQQFGFGLGLAITRAIVELMEGVITVASEVGKGTGFKIYLPIDILYEANLISDIPIARDTVTTRRHNYSEMKALVVDDVEFNREILQFHLNEYGFQCILASSGQEALELIKDQKFDVVLTDISMPKMGGIELATRLKDLQHDLPIIAVTARATVQEESRMNQYFDCYLTKPIDEMALTNALNCSLFGGSC